MSSAPHDPFYSSPFGPFYRRHTPYMVQPEYRIYEMNKRLQARSEDSDNLWWDAFATEFFEDDATLTLSFCLEDGPKRYSTRPSGAGAAVQKHHSNGSDKLHPQLPQVVCNTGANAGTDVKTQNLQSKSSRLLEDLLVSKMAENGGPTRTHKTTDNQTEEKEKLYQQHFEQQCWEQRK
uniref:LIM domain binding 2 n=1 Tax=Gallus gallus TaxID=9031 RepID=A0A8V0Y3F1_CHICK